MKLTPYFDSFKCQANDKQKTVQNIVQNIVLLHGWGMHSQIWDDLMPLLLERFNVTLIDLPGMGRSPLLKKTQDLPTIVAVIKDIVPQQTLLLGWSLGALVAMEFAKTCPEKVTGLISTAMGASFTSQPSWPHGIDADELKSFQNWFDEDWQGTLARFLALQCKNSDYQRKELHLLKHLVYYHGLPAKRALADGLNILAAANFSKWLTDAPINILFLLGKHDSIIPIESAEHLKKLNNNITVNILKKSAHIPFLSETERFIQYLDAWTGDSCPSPNPIPQRIS